MRVSAEHKAVRCAGAAGRPASLNINYLQHHRHLLGDYRTLCGVILQSTDVDSAASCTYDCYTNGRREINLQGSRKEMISIYYFEDRTLCD